MINVMEIVCDSCLKECASFSDVVLAAQADQQLANKGWLVRGIGGRVWHFCPTCKTEQARQRLSQQSLEDSAS